MSAPTGPDLAARYRVALEVARHVNATLDIEEVMDRTIDLLIGEVGAERGFIMLRGPQGGLVPHAMRRIDAEELRDDRFRTSRTLLDRVVEHGERVLTADAQTDERLAGRASVIGLGLRSIMAAPLRVRERVEGVVYLDNQSRLDAFTETDLELVAFVADLIAVGLENARAHAQVVASRDLFARYVNRQVAQAAGLEEALALEGARTEVAVLNADVRGFTPLARGMRASEIVTLLNTWLSDAIDHVLDYGGNVDKFMGDAILAVFGAPVPVEGGVRRAIAAAAETMRSVARLGELRGAEGQPAFEIGAGIDHGEVVAGNLGSERRLEYTVIGDPVNNVAWVASAARPMELLVTERAWESLDAQIPVREVRRIARKGGGGEQTVFSVDWEPMVR